MSMQFRILGPLAVSDGAGPVAIVAPRQQTVLAMLLLEANRPVSVDRLVDAVWDDDPPATARSQIQICVSALRRLLGDADAIATHPPGYLLRAAEGQLDLQAFEALDSAGRRAAEEGRLADAAASLGEALSLWRGEPLAGASSRLVQSAAVRLVERRLSAMEECIDIRLRLGAHHELIGELMELIAAHPLRERLRGQLMIALHRAGRRAEALEVYRSARSTLVEQLGLEPSEELRRLEQAVLANDVEVAAPALAPAAGVPFAEVDAVPRQLPADIVDFTGQGKLVAELRQLLGERARGEHNGCGAGIAVIGGKAGVGKTTLAVHVAHKMSDAFPDGQLYAQLDGAGTDPVPASQVLERFLRGLGVAGPAIPDGLQERAELYRSRLAARRVLVLLDDARDEEQVWPLLPGGPSCAVLLTSRFRLTSLPGAQQVLVDVLDSDRAIDLLTAVVGPERTYAERDGVVRLVELCGRLPLALRVAAARLAARPHWTVAQLVEKLEDDGRRLDELAHGGLEVRASIQRTYQGLSSRAKALLRRLGALETPDFASWVAGPLLGEDAGTAEEALESLADAYLLDVDHVPGRPARFRLHELVRAFATERVAVEEPPAERLGAMHRMLGAWLFLAHEGHRRQHGRLPGDGDGLRWALPAGLVDQLLADPREWYETERHAMLAAVCQAADAGADELSCDLVKAAVTLFEAQGRFEEANWRPPTRRSLAFLSRVHRRLDEAMARYESSLATLGVVRGWVSRALERSMDASTAFALPDAPAIAPAVATPAVAAPVLKERR